MDHQLLNTLMRPFAMIRSQMSLLAWNMWYIALVVICIALEMLISVFFIFLLLIVIAVFLKASVMGHRKHLYDENAKRYGERDADIMFRSCGWEKWWVE